MATSKKAHPKIAGCYWENGAIYYSIKVKGRRYRGSLYTSDPAVAKRRREEKKNELVGQARFGADVPTLLRHFDDHEKACKELLAAKLALPAYEQVLKASHTFNLLDARRAISVT